MYESVIKKKYKLEVYGMPENVALEHPLRISDLGLLWRLKRGWESGIIQFRRVMETTESGDGSSGGAGFKQGSENEPVVKRRMRKVMTIGLKAKGQIKSPEFVLE